MKIFKNLFGKSMSRQDRELDYLNHSISMSDLERRQREIERGLFRK